MKYISHTFAIIHLYICGSACECILPLILARVYNGDAICTAVRAGGAIATNQALSNHTMQFVKNIKFSINILHVALPSMGAYMYLHNNAHTQAYLHPWQQTLWRNYLHDHLILLYFASLDHPVYRSGLQSTTQIHPAHIIVTVFSILQNETYYLNHLMAIMLISQK